MYSNSTKISISICIWSFLMVIGAVGTFTFAGVFCEELGNSDPVQLALFLIFGAGCFSLVVIYVRKLMFFATISKLERIFNADEDGYIPLDEAVSETGEPGVKLIKITRKAISRRYMINLNYDAANKAFLLSDKVKEAHSVHSGVPEDRKFIGIICPGCAANLKVRLKTSASCPYCGREIIASE